MLWPMATMITSASTRTGGWSAFSGRGRPGLVDGAYPLGLDPQGNGVVFAVGLNPQRRHHGQQLRTFSQRALHLVGQGGHVLLPAAIDHADGFRTQTDGGAGAVPWPRCRRR